MRISEVRRPQEGTFGVHKGPPLTTAPTFIVVHRNSTYIVFLLLHRAF
jgi:hypothetical protein